MAEEQTNPNTENQEQNPEEVLKEMGDRLFDLLSKKELSDAEKAEIQEQITKLPQVLCSKNFMGHFEMPDLLSAYQKGEDMHALLENNAAARETLSVVLENLKQIELPQGTTAAKYMLDNAWLPNGELIGTQFAKNMHFLVAAYMDDKTPALQDDDLKRAIDSDHNQMADLYKKLYDKNEGYNANPNRRNFLGQKVEDVMKASIETPRESVEDLKNQVFVQTPDERQEMVIDQARGTMTLEDLQMARYRGTLTAEQAELLKKEEDKKKEADLGNFDGDNPRFKRKHDSKGFKDEDVIKYMYEDWFLASLSWLFDRAEDGAYALLGALISDRNYNEPLEAKASTKTAEPFADAVKAFHQDTMNSVKRINASYHGQDVDGRHIEGQREKADRLGKELLAFCKTLEPGQTPDQATEADLKERYGEAFIDKLKEDYRRDPEGVKHFMTNGVQNMLLMSELTDVISQRLAQLEMTNEAMNDASVWKQPGTDKLMDPAQLRAERDRRAKKIKQELMEAYTLAAEEERVWASVRYDQLTTPEQKDQFVQDEIINTANPADKEKLEQQYKALKEKGTPEQIKAWVCENIGSQRAMNFLNSQAQGISDTMTLIREDLNQGRYSANERRPSPKVGERLRAMKTQRQEIQEDGVQDAKLEGGERLQVILDHKTDLFQAAQENNVPNYFERIREINEKAQEALKERREKNNKRKRTLDAWKKKYLKKNKYIEHQTEQGLPLTKPQNYSR